MLLDDETEGSRVVEELHYILTKIDDHCAFIDNLVEVVDHLGGKTHHATLDLLDGRGTFSAEDVVTGVILATAAAEKLLKFGEEKQVSEGVVPKADIHYLDFLHQRFGDEADMAAIAGRLNRMSKEGIASFLAAVRDEKTHPAKALYTILNNGN